MNERSNSAETQAALEAVLIKQIENIFAEKAGISVNFPNLVEEYGIITGRENITLSNALQKILKISEKESLFELLDDRSSLETAVNEWLRQLEMQGVLPEDLPDFSEEG